MRLPKLGRPAPATGTPIIHNADDSPCGPEHIARGGVVVDGIACFLATSSRAHSHSPSVARAKAPGERIRAEDGVGRAVEIIARHFA